jgi:urease accessory protein UreF
MTSHVLHRSLKHGLGRLTATADVSAAATETSKAIRSTTRLTQVSHKAPTRLIPLPKSSVQKAGAAICALSNYGAGMLQGDSVDLNIHVEQGATLGVTTQGTSRIYSQRRTLTAEEHEDPHVDRICRIHLEGQVHEDALLVLAPDPCALFAHSSLAQRQVFQVHPKSSVVLVDWFSSGRYRNGERWEFDLLSAQTSLKWLRDDREGGAAGGGTGEESSSYPSIPFLQDSLSMDYRIPTAFPDPFGVNGINSFASVILYGDQAAPVVKVCQALQDKLAASHTRIRTRSTSEASFSNGDNDKSFAWLESSLAGRVYCGVSQVKLLDPDQEDRVAHVARFTATTNEDLYRILHQCLLPLERSFGLQFYKDRIHSSVSEIAKATPVDDQEEVLMASHTKERDSRRRVVVPSGAASDALRGVVQNGKSDAFWAAFMLADSSMPTGSFAHSAGLEAAAQLGMIQNESDVQKFVLVATRSAMQTLTPLTMAGHRLGVLATSDTAKERDQFDFVEQWATLDQQAQAVMATNAPACAASLDQGKSLGRVVVQWLRDQKSDNANTDEASKRQELVQHLQHGGHLGPMMGVVGALLNLDSIQVCRLLGYCVARDMVSASVRLSLVGPLASVRLLHQVQGVVQEGLQASLLAMEEGAYDDVLASATSSPVLEALHPCHDLLQVRLFRT